MSVMRSDDGLVRLALRTLPRDAASADQDRGLRHWAPQPAKRQPRRSIGPTGPIFDFENYPETMWRKPGDSASRTGPLSRPVEECWG